MLPLNGVRVIDLSTVVLGPLASQTLADYGAEVIKVEAPDGDSTRNTGPSREAGMSSIFLGANRNKRSIVLDLKTPAGRDALIALVAAADVFMHSMRPQKLTALGLGSDVLLARNPRLVFAGLHGFLEQGPYSGTPAYDDIIQGLSGNAALMHMQTGQAGYFPTIAADKICAQVATHAILAALFQRERTGRGGVVDVPMFESMVAFNLVEHFYGMHFDPPQSEPGYPRLLTKWRRPFETTDGYVCMMPYTNMHWRRFFEEAGEAALADDPRFTDIGERTRNIDALYETASRIIRGRTTAEWIETCRRIDIPAAKVNELHDLLDDPQLRAQNFFVDIDDEKMGRLRFPGVPVRFDGVCPEIDLPPRLGQHTREILQEAGFENTEIDALIDSKAARQA
jgi:crotonobetainyl-CoA:carnitine CoA-transferase CaiB-like acyl-CoA transferase